MTLRTPFTALAGVLLALTACGDDSSDDDSGGGGDAGDSGPVERPDGGGAGTAAAAGDAASDSSAPGDGGTGDASVAQREVTLRFAAKVGDDPFACGETYEGIGSSGTTITPRDLRFYVQDLALVTADGDEVPVVLEDRSPWQSQSDRIVLIDLTTADEGCANSSSAEINAEITGTVPEGDYTGVAFTNGVPEPQNHSDPAELSAPLQVSGMQWSWLLGYRFLKMEVGAVDQAAEMLGGGGVHIGATGCAGAPLSGFTCMRDNRNRIELDDYDVDTDAIVFDVGALFQDVDLAQNAQCHGGGPVCEAAYPQLGIDYATGAARIGQTVYRVEPAE